MNGTPLLFDRAALAQHRARARRDALFLHDAARDEVQDRLSMVNRTFTKLAIVTPFPDIWSPAFPDATCVGDDDVLTLDPRGFDLVVHAMCLHWANDPVGQLIQSRRALMPDGLFLAVMLGGRTLSELRAALAEAEVAVTGGLSPRISPMAEIRDLGGLLQRAGFALPVADGTTLRAQYRDASHLMHDLRDMGEANALLSRPRTPARREIFAETNRLYHAHFGAENGIRASFEIITLTGWAPSGSQPKPLRPGSAAARLADALNTDEMPLPD